MGRVGCKRATRRMKSTPYPFDFLISVTMSQWLNGLLLVLILFLLLFSLNMSPDIGWEVTAHVEDESQSKGKPEAHGQVSCYHKKH